MLINLLASPAGSKLGLRMTTLHEEPLRQNPLHEENEDSYSDPEYDYESKPSSTNLSMTKNRMKPSHTIDSFMDIEKKTSTNLLNYKLLTQHQPFHLNSQTQSQTQTDKTSTKKGDGSPSMNSSTSSGYGSQAVSCSNLTSEDTLSLRSMSADDTPGNFNFFKCFPFN